LGKEGWVTRATIDLPVATSATGAVASGRPADELPGSPRIPRVAAPVYKVPALSRMQGSAFLELALEFGEVVRDLPPRSEPGERRK
jgi:hypothetical protein